MYKTTKIPYDTFWWKLEGPIFKIEGDMSKLVEIGCNPKLWLVAMETGL